MRELFRYRGGASLIKIFNDANNQRNFISREYYIEIYFLPLYLKIKKGISENFSRSRFNVDT